MIMYNTIFCNHILWAFYFSKKMKSTLFQCISKLKHNARSEGYFRNDKMNHNNVQTGLASDAVEAAELGLVAKKKRKIHYKCCEHEDKI